MTDCEAIAPTSATERSAKHGTAFLIRQPVSDDPLRVWLFSGAGDLILATNSDAYEEQGRMHLLEPTMNALADRLSGATCILINVVLQKMTRNLCVFLRLETSIIKSSLVHAFFTRHLCRRAFVFPFLNNGSDCCMSFDRGVAQPGRQHVQDVEVVCSIHRPDYLLRAEQLPATRRNSVEN